MQATCACEIEWTGFEFAIDNNIYGLIARAHSNASELKLVIVSGHRYTCARVRELERARSNAN